MLERKTQEELTENIAEILGERLLMIVLYGSYARGTQTPESDVDIALIVGEEVDAATMDRLQDFLVDMDMKHEKLFSVVEIDADRFEKFQDALPFYRNIQREGVVLWKTA